MEDAIEMPRGTELFLRSETLEAAHAEPMMRKLRDAYVKYYDNDEGLTDAQVVKYARAEVKRYYRETRPFKVRLKRLFRGGNNPIVRVAHDVQTYDREGMRVIAGILLDIEAAS